VIWKNKTSLFVGKESIILTTLNTAASTNTVHVLIGVARKWRYHLAQMSQFQILDRALKKSLKQWPKLIKSNWLVLFGIVMLVQVQSQFFLYFSQAFKFDQAVSLICQLGLSFSSLVESIFLIMLVPLRIMEMESQSPPRKFMEFFEALIGPLTVEGLRMTAMTLLWSILFVIPGLYFSVRWYFLPFVVMFNPDYAKGEVDCLKRSYDLTKNIFFILVLVILVDAGISYGIESFAMSFNESLQPLTFFLSGILTTGVSILTYSIYYWIYKQRVDVLVSSAEVPEPQKAR